MRKISKSQIIISILAMLNIIFVPVFDVWGGLFPSHAEDDFFDVMYYLFYDTDAWSYNVFRFTIAIFIPTVIMLLTSILGLRKAAKVAGVGGILWLIIELILFVDEYGISYLFDFDDGNISIGLWVGLALFIAMTLVRTKKKTIIEPTSNSN